MKNDDCAEGGAHGAILWCPSMERWRCELCGTRFSPHVELEHVRRELETPYRNLVAKLRALNVSEVGEYCGQPPDIVAAVYWGTYVTVRESEPATSLSCPECGGRQWAEREGERRCFTQACPSGGHAVMVADLPPRKV